MVILGMHEKDQITFENLVIDKIFGTSSSSKSCFCHSGSKVAYVASGGVVVSDVELVNESTGEYSSAEDNQSIKGDIESTDLEGNECGFRVSSQRFFCAYSTVQLSSDLILPSATAIKDAFGMFKQDQSILIKGSNWRDTEEAEKVSYASTSDLTPARLTPSKLKNKIKTISCLSLSIDGRYMVVGEVGHKPRILIYSLAPDSNDFPVFVIQQHSFGVANLKFHPTDARIFMSLGLINDGFIHIWKLTTNGVVLLATNKNISLVKDVLWYDSRFLTYGVRHLKEWKFDHQNPQGPVSKVPSSRSRTALKGKNIVLGEFLNATFIDATLLADNRIFLLTDKNYLLLYENSQLSSIYNLEHCVEGHVVGILADYENDTLWAIAEGDIHPISLKYILENQEKIKPNDHAIASHGSEKYMGKFIQNLTVPTSQPALLPGSSSNLQGIITIRKFDVLNLLYVTTEGCLGFFDVNNQRTHPIVYSVLNNIAGCKRSNNNCILLWSKEGCFKRWDEYKEHVISLGFSLNPYLPFANSIDNEITAAEMFETANRSLSLAIGTKVGDLHIYELHDDDVTKKILDTRAHSSKINDITHIQLGTKIKIDIVVSISRDRTIQVFLFKEGKWNLQETLTDNKGNVIKMVRYQNILFVASADRSIARYRFEFIDGDLIIYKEKILSIKSSPVNIHLFGDKVIISTNDKQLLIYDKAFEKYRSLKVYSDTDEPIMVENLFVNLANPKQEEILCSSSDKVLRCYNFVTGKLLKQYFGHSEPIIALLTSQTGKLLSISSNGCIFCWSPHESNVHEEWEVAKPLSSEIIRPIAKDASEDRAVSRKVKKYDLARSSSTKIQYTSVSPVKPYTHLTSNEAPSPDSPRLTKVITNQRFQNTPLKASNTKISTRNTESDGFLQYSTLLSQLKKFRTQVIPMAEDIQDPHHEAIINEIKMIYSVIEPPHKLLEKYSESLLNLVEEKFQKL